MNNQQPDKFNVNNDVAKRRNQLLKVRLQTLIYERGMKESEFYHSLGMSKHTWYKISWGIIEPSIEMKIRIAEKLETDSALIFSGKKEGVESGT